MPKKEDFKVKESLRRRINSHCIVRNMKRRAKMNKKISKSFLFLYDNSQKTNCFQLSSSMKIYVLVTLDVNNGAFFHDRGDLIL